MAETITQKSSGANSDVIGRGTSSADVSLDGNRGHVTKAKLKHDSNEERKGGGSRHREMS